MMTLKGISASAGDELSATVTARGASEVRATVQLAVAGGVIDVELQENPFRLSGAMVTVPPDVAVDSSEPVGSAETPLESCKKDDVSVVVAETASEMVAKAPLPIAVSFWPESTQVTTPDLGLQLRDLLADVAAGPADTDTDEKSVAE
jgi:hypothetical protein